jgi:hypothetical protein
MSLRNSYLSKIEWDKPLKDNCLNWRTCFKENSCNINFNEEYLSITV